MRLADVSARRIEDVSGILRKSSASAVVVSNLSGKTFAEVEECRCKPLTCSYPHVLVDGIHLKRS